MSHGRLWLEPAGSEDSHGRALWALGTGVTHSRSEGRGRLSAYLFEHAIDVVAAFTSPRAWAFSLLGLNEYLQVYPLNIKALALRRDLTTRLLKLWDTYSTPDWPWFENSATYDNARICQALILSGQNIPDARAVDVGLKSLRWLASIQKTQAGHFRPVGSNGFYIKDGARADFDQQPVEAQAMVSACLEAFRATQDATWSREAKRAFEWFLGRNDLGLPLYDSSNGGCYDGLHPDRVNENQGAESTLAFHLSLAEMNFAEHLVATPPSLHS